MYRKELNDTTGSEADLASAKAVPTSPNRIYHFSASTAVTPSNSSDKMNAFLVLCPWGRNISMVWFNTEFK